MTFLAAEDVISDDPDANITGDDADANVIGDADADAGDYADDGSDIDWSETPNTAVVLSFVHTINIHYELKFYLISENLDKIDRPSQLNTTWNLSHISFDFCKGW